MRKLSLILAILLLMTSCVFTACDKKSNSDSEEATDSSDINSAPAKAAKNLFKAMYVDFNAEAYYKASVDCNLELVEKYFADSADLEEYKESVNQNMAQINSQISRINDTLIAEYGEGYRLKYKAIYCNTYNKENSDIFDDYIDSFKYEGTDVGNSVDQIAIVGILITVDYTKNGEKCSDANITKYTCYRINNVWYVAD